MVLGLLAREGGGDRGQPCPTSSMEEAGSEGFEIVRFQPVGADPSLEVGGWGRLDERELEFFSWREVIGERVGDRA